ncbi:MAG: hypothetical protein ACO3ZY_09850, partial [Phycisphaerales bacterium]
MPTSGTSRGAAGLAGVFEVAAVHGSASALAGGSVHPGVLTADGRAVAFGYPASANSVPTAA